LNGFTGSGGGQQAGDAGFGTDMNKLRFMIAAAARRWRLNGPGDLRGAKRRKA
jgi:hypothetical protein